MVKSKKGPKRGQPKAKSKNNKSVGKYSSGRGSQGLDAGAARYLKLLGDPCNANLAPPVYGSMDSGYLVRVKQTIPIPANAVDGIVQFNANGASGFDNNELAMWAAGYSDGVGGSLGNAYGTFGPLWLRNASVGWYRPVAGCIKLFYSGSELNRGGMIGSIISPTAMIRAGTAIGAPSVDSYFDTANRVARLGSEDHEVRWLPMSPEDQGFSYATSPQGNTHLDNTCIAFVYRGVPAGTLRIEATFVYEWVPASMSGMARPIAPPASKVPTQTILAHIGDAVKFATSPETMRRVGQIANTVAGAYNAVRSSAPLLMMA